MSRCTWRRRAASIVVFSLLLAQANYVLATDSTLQAAAESTTTIRALTSDNPSESAAASSSPRSLTPPARTPMETTSSPARVSKLQTWDGGLATSLSATAFADAVRRRVLPALRDSLQRTLQGLVGQRVDELYATAASPAPATTTPATTTAAITTPATTTPAAPTAVPVARQLPDTHDATFEAVHFDPATVDLQVELTGPREIRLTASSGPLGFDLSAEVCYGNCLLGCCIRSRARFTVRMNDVRVGMTLTPQQLLQGVSPTAPIAPPKVETVGLAVDFGTPHIGGVVGWLSGMSLVAEFLNIFGAPGAILDAVARDPLAASLETTLEMSVADQFAGLEFAGLHALDLAVPLPGSSPGHLAVRFPEAPQIRTGEAIALAIETALGDTTVTSLDAAAAIASTALHGVDDNADFALAASDGTLNQILALVASEGGMRARFAGMTLGEFAPEIDFPTLGIGPGTPIVIAIDAARDARGRVRPPSLDLTDDPGTEELEFRLRAPVAVRAILDRAGTNPPDSILVPCSIENTGYGSQPCSLYETEVDLGLVAKAHLVTVPSPPTAALLGKGAAPTSEIALELEVTSVQELAPAALASGVEMPPTSVVRVQELAPTPAPGNQKLATTLGASSAGLVPTAASDSLELAQQTTASGQDAPTAATDSLELAPQTATDSLAPTSTVERRPPVALWWDASTAVVATSEDSRELALVQKILNTTIPPILLPNRAQFLGDGVAFTNLRLFSRSAGDAHANDYVGVVADFATELPPEVPVDVASADAKPIQVAPPARHALHVPMIRTGMPSESRWSLTIYDASGRTVRNLQGSGGPGFVEIQWDGRGEDGQFVTSGEYVYRFATAGYQESRKMSLNE